MDGVPMSAHVLGTATLDGSRFMALVMIRDDGSIFEKGYQSAAKEKGARSFTQGGLPAVEVQASGPKSVGTVRYIRAKDRMYMLVVECQPDRAAGLKADVARFMGSFKVEPAAKPATKPAQPAAGKK
ncbi:MAG: hypothetical protein QM767_15630 [Anaeromyxobacter sp.]